MTKTVLGKVCLTPRGEYEQEAEYEPLDVITCNGTSWLVTASFAGIEPSEANENVQLLAQAGATGQSAFQYALAVGYAGTEEDFARDLAGVDGLSRKADLSEEGFVRADQLQPQSGKQTGVTGTSYRTSQPGLLLTSDKTIEVFLRLPDVTDISTVNIYLEAYSSPSSGLYFVWYPNSGQIHCYYGGASMSVSVRKGQLYHLVASIKDGQCSFYVNGNLISSRTPETVQSPTLFYFVFLYTKGYILRQFNRGLSQEEVSILWNKGMPDRIRIKERAISGCSAEYIADGLLSDRWRDTSGNGFDITTTENYPAELLYEKPCFERVVESSGTPARAPELVGQIFIDTDTGNIFISTGTTSSADWKLIS